MKMKMHDFRGSCHGDSDDNDDNSHDDGAGGNEDSVVDVEDMNMTKMTSKMRMTMKTPIVIVAMTLMMAIKMKEVMPMMTAMILIVTASITLPKMIREMAMRW